MQLKGWMYVASEYVMGRMRVRLMLQGIGAEQ